MSGPRSRLAKVAVATAALALSGVAQGAERASSPELENAGWTLITASEDVFVYMRPAGQGAAGLRRVWTAYDSDGPREHDGFTFRSVESLGEFDCRRNLSRVVEEIYHDAPALQGKSWRSPKFIPTPWARPETDSVGAIRMAFACRTLTDT